MYFGPPRPNARGARGADARELSVSHTNLERFTDLWILSNRKRDIQQLAEGAWIPSCPTAGVTFFRGNDG